MGVGRAVSPALGWMGSCTAGGAPARLVAAPTTGLGRASGGVLGADMDHAATVDEVSPSTDLPCVRPFPSSSRAAKLRSADYPPA